MGAFFAPLRVHFGPFLLFYGLPGSMVLGRSGL